MHNGDFEVANLYNPEKYDKPAVVVDAWANTVSPLKEYMATLTDQILIGFGNQAGPLKFSSVADLRDSKINIRQAKFY